MFEYKTDKIFAGIVIIVCSSLCPLSPLRGVLMYVLKDNRLEATASYNLWDMFSFIKLLNKTEVGNFDEDVENVVRDVH